MRLRRRTVPGRAHQRTGAGIRAHGRPAASSRVAGRTGCRVRTVRRLRLRHLVGRAAARLRFLGRRAPPPAATPVADRARCERASPARRPTDARARSRQWCWSVRSRWGGSRLRTRARGASAALGSGRDGPPGDGDQPGSHRRQPILARAARARSARRALFGGGRGRAAMHGARSRASTSTTGCSPRASLRAAYLAPLAPGLNGASMALGPGSGPPVVRPRR